MGRRVAELNTPTDGKAFFGMHILSVEGIQREHVDRLFAVADMMLPYARREKRNRVLDGAILGSMFFEPSTRTRISFSCAFDLLGGAVRETTGFEHSAIAKGESLYDTAQVLSGYSDVIVMRHPQVGAVQQFAAASRVPVINAGDGSNEHPTQALLDLYTIGREMERMHGVRNADNIRIALVGDLKYGRTVHSLCRLLCLYRGISLHLVSPPELAAPEELLELMRAAGHQVSVGHQLAPHIDNVDIIYSTRLQEERFPDSSEVAQYRNLLRLNRPIYTLHCQPNTAIMHPLPRDSRDGVSELDEDLNDNPNLAIFRQTDNGLLVRMALFVLMFDVVELMPKYDVPIHWRSRRRS